MRPNEYPPFSVKPTEKTRSYLEKVGLLDGRTGRKPKKAKVSLNAIINAAIVHYFETGKHRSLDPAPSWLLKANFCLEQIQANEAVVRERVKVIRALTRELEAIPGLDLDWLANQRLRAVIQPQEPLTTPLYEDDDGR